MDSRKIDISIVIDGEIFEVNDSEPYNIYSKIDYDTFLDNTNLSMNEFLIHQVEKNIKYAKDKGLTVEVVNNIKNAKGKYVANFQLGVWYPEYRIHFQWRMLAFIANKFNITHSCYDLVWDPYINKTFVDKSVKTNTLFYRKNRITGGVANDPEIPMCVVIKKIDNEALEIYCDSFIKNGDKDVLDEIEKKMIFKLTGGIGR